jgi:prepilin-type N-terminal cleavage/methylation domain-containing protein
MKNEQGFSLVELLIVVAIIAIIAAIAVPSLLTSRMAANEAGAIQGCRTMGSAEIAFAAINNQNYGTVTELCNGNFLDARFSRNAPIDGYVYASGDVAGTTMDGAVPAQFGFIATPTGTGGMGRYIFGIAPDQVVRFNSAASGYTLPSGVAAGDPIGQSQVTGT